ncbi:hypothetical protein WICMUC_002197 [Wickerhamomyces mucosus]|uniref:Rab-GAP TBC domain-containing protein n=1 Tax=Wickerhamomyces mucosus TaxID=1378264 RepID=A0A9P8TF08_9ASCO|nr:hypothetical protein WICMUC_002197 [Wickerhamomyces mucosus]
MVDSSDANLDRKLYMEEKVNYADDYVVTTESIHDLVKLHTNITKSGWIEFIKEYELHSDIVNSDILPRHKDEDQVQLDVERSFVYYPTNIASQHRDQLKIRLKKLIIKVLRNYPHLSYYQGYHDISGVVLLMLDDDEMAYRALTRLTLVFLRDFMMPDIKYSLNMLNLIPELIKLLDSELYEKLDLAQIQPIFALSPIITLYSHDFQDLQLVELVFKEMVSQKTIFISLYIFASLVVQKKKEILKTLELNSDFEKSDVIHNTLSKFLSTTTKDELTGAIENSQKYLVKYPPSKLKSFKLVGNLSVLKTKEARNFKSLIDEQIKESKSPVKLPRLSLISKILVSQQTQNVIKLTIAVGVLSILLGSLADVNSPAISFITGRLSLINTIKRIWREIHNNT